MKRVWMNHWFSTALNIIDLMRQDYVDLYIIGSNENEYSVIKNGCDEWYQEPVLNDDKYVEFLFRILQRTQYSILSAEKRNAKNQ